MWQGDSNHRLGRSEVSRQLMEQSLALLKRPELAGQDTRRERATVLLEMAWHTIDSDLEEARRLADQSLALFQALGDLWWTAYALGDVGQRSMNVGAYGEARQPLERSLALFQRLGDPRQIAWSMRGLGVVAMLQGQLDEAEQLFRKSIAICQEIEDRQFLGMGLLRLGGTLCFSGKFTQSQSLLEESLAIFDDLGNPAWSAQSYWNLGRRDMLLGQWERASTSAHVSLVLSQETRYSVGIALSYWLQCCLALAEGERGLDAGIPPYLRQASEAREPYAEAYAEARRLAQESAAVLQEIHERGFLSWALAVLGPAERGLGELDGAQLHIGEALHISAETGAFLPPLFALPAIALLLAGRGERERAVELYALASRYPFVGNSRWHELVFGRHIDAVAATLPPDVVASAQERGRAREMATTLAELVEELGG